jgi:hypothetical protein
VSLSADPESERLTLLALSRSVNGDGTAHPTVAALAAETRLPTISVQLALRGLEASGAIARAGLRNGGPAYTIVGP